MARAAWTTFKGVLETTQCVVWEVRIGSEVAWEMTFSAAAEQPAST